MYTKLASIFTAVSIVITLGSSTVMAESNAKKMMGVLLDAEEQNTFTAAPQLNDESSQPKFRNNEQRQREIQQQSNQFRNNEQRQRDMRKQPINNFIQGGQGDGHAWQEALRDLERAERRLMSLRRSKVKQRSLRALRAAIGQVKRGVDNSHR